MDKKNFIGVDVGGTKIAGALVTKKGVIIARAKLTTPSKARRSQIIAVILQLIKKLLTMSNNKQKNIAGIGMGIPGIVNEAAGKVIRTVNINLSGCDLVRKIRKNIDVPIAIGNDVNLGLLGEKWLGAATDGSQVIGLFPGTGIGGAIIIDGKLLSGAGGAAAEIGHMVMDVTGPRCSCGNNGCLEALASRWAIERDIRAALRRKKKSILTKIARGKLSRIKSKMLSKALQRKDPVVTTIMKRSAHVLGLACVSLRHIFDPEIIVFGGGVIEACGYFMLPIVKKRVAADPFFKSLPHCRIVASKLGDDAVMLGAVALIQQQLGIKLFDQTSYPTVRARASGVIAVNGTMYTKDIYIRADGKIKKRNRKKAKQLEGTSLKIGPGELQQVCKKRSETLILGVAPHKPLVLTKAAKQFLKAKKIHYVRLPLHKAIKVYNKTSKRKTILLQTSQNGK